MSQLDVILPTIVLLLAFVMKLLVDQAATVPLAIETTYALPIDIVFLAITFAAAYAISKPDNAGSGLVYFAVFIGVAMLTVFMSRRSTHLFDRDKRKVSAALFLLNFAVSMTTLILSVHLLLEIRK